MGSNQPTDSVQPLPFAPRTWFFGQWLTDTEAVEPRAVAEAVALMKTRNRRLGEVAIEQGLLSESGTQRIQLAQRGTDTHFGDMAVQLGYLTPEQVKEALRLQSNQNLKLGEALVELKHVSEEQLCQLLERYHAAVRTREETARLPELFSSNPTLVGLIDLLPRTLLRASQKRAKVGAGAPLHGEEPGCDYGCTLLASDGLRVYFGVEQEVGDALAKSTLLLPEDERVAPKVVYETLEEVLEWLLEATANALGYVYQQVPRGEASGALPPEPAIEFPVAFANGSGKLVISKRG